MIRGDCSANLAHEILDSGDCDCDSIVGRGPSVDRIAAAARAAAAVVATAARATKTGDSDPIYGIDRQK